MAQSPHVPGTGVAKTSVTARLYRSDTCRDAGLTPTFVPFAKRAVYTHLYVACVN